jgi:hypothetical protein
LSKAIALSCFLTVGGFFDTLKKAAGKSGSFSGV